jgi:hypothetical protein
MIVTFLSSGSLKKLQRAGDFEPVLSYGGLKTLYRAGDFEPLFAFGGLKKFQSKWTQWKVPSPLPLKSESGDLSPSSSLNLNLWRGFSLPLWP